MTRTIFSPWKIEFEPKYALLVRIIFSHSLIGEFISFALYPKLKIRVYYLASIEALGSSVAAATSETAISGGLDFAFSALSLICAML